MTFVFYSIDVCVFFNKGNYSIRIFDRCYDQVYSYPNLAKLNLWISILYSLFLYTVCFCYQRRSTRSGFSRQHLASFIFNSASFGLPNDKRIPKNCHSKTRAVHGTVLLSTSSSILFLHGFDLFIQRGNKVKRINYLIQIRIWQDLKQI